ncbi:MAG: hypothetical protein R3Y32_05950 [Bacillota bacterium]
MHHGHRGGGGGPRRHHHRRRGPMGCCVYVLGMVLLLSVIIGTVLVIL